MELTIREIIEELAQPHIKKRELESGVIEKGRWVLGTILYGQATRDKAVVLKNEPYWR